MRRRILIVLFLGYTAIWTALLLVPDVTSVLFIPSALPEELAQSELPVDKIVHVIGYFMLTALAIAAFGRLPRGVSLGWLCGGAALHGAATEIAQLLIPPRSSELMDWFADLTGVTVALLCVVAFRRMTAGRSPQSLL
jgi:VanZ family protein